jgi:GntR family transcriptional regulator, rspAB operon transcriptional repressor
LTTSGITNGERRGSATTRVLDHILQAMDEGLLLPGGRVNAARIATQLELSIAPVREALGVLAGRGVVDLHADRGATVKSLDAYEVCQIWQVLAAVGGVGLRLAAHAIEGGASGVELDIRFQRILADAETATPVEFISNFSKWHYEANDLGGNDYINIALDRICVPYWDRYLVHVFDVDANRNRYVQTYRRMHDAVMSGDAESAFATFQYHARWSIATITAQEEKRTKGRRVSASAKRPPTARGA